MARVNLRLNRYNFGHLFDYLLCWGRFDRNQIRQITDGTRDYENPSDLDEVGILFQARIFRTVPLSDQGIQVSPTAVLLLRDPPKTLRVILGYDCVEAIYTG